jgi:hypothetical protein
MAKEEYRVFYRTDASAHYIDLAVQKVEIIGREARVELNGQPMRCIVEDVERAASGGRPHAMSNLYLRRKS